MALQPLLEVADLTCRRGGRRVFDRLSFAVGAGELLGLVGRNGSGKTTLLRALALLIRPDGGQIRWRGIDVWTDAEAWHSQMAWLGHLDGLKADLSIRENLLIAEAVRGARAGHDRVDAALIAFDLAALATRPVRTLSAGQRRRAALARVVMTQAPVWLLDEPLNALDQPAQQAFRANLERHLVAGGLVIAATHADLGLPGARNFELGLRP